MDPVIAQAGINVGLVPTVLQNLLPIQLTMWIDSAEVSYRIGENGSIGVLFEGSNQTLDQSEHYTQRQQQQHQQHYHHQHYQLQHLHHSQQHYHRYQLSNTITRSSSMRAARTCCC